MRDWYDRWARQPSPPRRRRRSRRAVVFTVGIFVIIQAGMWAAYRFVPTLRDPHYRMAWNEAGRPVPGQAKVVLLGSSRLAMGWQPESLQGSTSVPAVHWANLAKLGGGALTMNLYQRRLIEEGVAAQLLILELNPLVFTQHYWQQEVQANYWPAHRLWPSQQGYFRQAAGHLRPGFAEEWAQAEICPLLARRFDLLALTAPRLLSYYQRLDREIVLGSATDAATLTGGQRQANIEILHRRLLPLLAKTTLVSEPQQIMKDLLASCRDRGQPVVMVLMPEGPAFRALYPSPYWTAFRALAKALETEFGVPLLDCRAWMQEEDFADSHHLTRQGGERFTRRFWQEHLQHRLRP